MHEAGIMESVLAIANSRAKDNGVSKVRELRMRVGILRGIAAEALEHAFDVLRAGTVAREAQLAVDFIPAVYWCAACGREFETSNLFGECPVCRAFSGDIRHGLELELVSMEVD